MPTPAQSISTFQTDVDLLDQVIHGDATTMVDLGDGGTQVPSLRKAIASVAAPTPVASVKAALAAALPANTNVAGVITANANGAFPMIDGVAIGVGDRWLYWDYTGGGGSNAKYWIYTLTTAGDGGSPWVATRAVDANDASELSGVSVFVTGGATWAGYTFELPVQTVVPSTTALTPRIVASPTGVAAEIARAEGAEAAIKATTVTGGGLATGGGDLTANRVITVPAASNADADAGASTTLAMTPAAAAHVTNAMKATTVTGGGLATGGGDLSANRVITVPAALNADADAGVSTTLAMTPAAAAHVTGAIKATTVTGGGLATGGGDLTGNRVITVPAASNADADAGVSTALAMTPAATAHVLGAAVLQLENADSAEAEQRAADEEIIGERLDALEGAESARDGFQQGLSIADGTRPGDAADLYTDAVTSDVANAQPTAATIVVTADGSAARLIGGRVLARRRLENIEYNRRYRCRLTARRFQDSADPDGDAVILAMAWFDAGKTQLAGVNAFSIIAQLDNLTVADGSMVITGDIARAPFFGTQVERPAAAVYGQLYVEAYGDATTQTDIVSLDVEDITESFSLGQVTRQKARLAATGNVNLATLANGTVIDGVASATGDIVLLPAQTDGKQNGLYTVPAGAGNAVRLAGFDTDWNELVGLMVFVTAGNTLHGSIWFCTANGDSGVLGQTVVDFFQNSAVGALMTVNDLSDVGDAPTALANLGAQARTINIGTRQRQMEEWLADGAVTLRDFATGTGGSDGSGIIDWQRKMRSQNRPGFIPEGNWVADELIPVSGTGALNNYVIGNEYPGDDYRVFGCGERSVIVAANVGGAVFRMLSSGRYDIRSLKIDSAAQTSGAGFSTKMSSGRLDYVISANAYSSCFLFNGTTAGSVWSNCIAEGARHGHAFAVSSFTDTNGVTWHPSRYRALNLHDHNCYGSGFNRAGSRGGIVNGLLSVWDKTDANGNLIDFPSNYAGDRDGNDGRDNVLTNFLIIGKYRGLRQTDSKNSFVFGGSIKETMGPAITGNSKDQMAEGCTIAGVTAKNTNRGAGRPTAFLEDDDGGAVDDGVYIAGGDSWTLQNIVGESDVFHPAQGLLSVVAGSTKVWAYQNVNTGGHYNTFDRMVNIDEPLSLLSTTTAGDFSALFGQFVSMDNNKTFYKADGTVLYAQTGVVAGVPTYAPALNEADPLIAFALQSGNLSSASPISINATAVHPLDYANGQPFYYRDPGRGFYIMNSSTIVGDALGLQVGFSVVKDIHGNPTNTINAMPLDPMYDATPHLTAKVLAGDRLYLGDNSRTFIGTVDHVPSDTQIVLTAASTINIPDPMLDTDPTDPHHQINMPIAISGKISCAHADNTKTVTGTKAFLNSIIGTQIGTGEVIALFRKTNNYLIGLVDHVVDENHLILRANANFDVASEEFYWAIAQKTDSGFHVENSVQNLILGGDCRWRGAKNVEFNVPGQTLKLPVHMGMVENDEVNIPSAGVLDLTGMNSPKARVTGNTTINSVLARNNARYYLRFTSAGITLSHSGNLVLPGGVDYTTGVVNDYCIMDTDGSTPPVARCHFFRGDGTAVTDIPPRVYSDAVTLTAGAYTSVAGDLFKVLQVTTGNSDATITLMSAVTAGDGALQAIRKVDAGTGKVIVHSGSDLAWLSTQHDTITLRSDGANWRIYGYTIAPVLTIFTSSGSWVTPPLLAEVDVWACAGGNGGGSGRRGAAASARAGGNGGAGPTIVRKRLLGSDVSGTITITIGSGGSGGAAQTVDSTDGNAGSAGGATNFGTLISAANAGGSSSGGAGGTAAVVTGPLNSGSRGNYSMPAQGGNTSVTSAGGTGGQGPAGGGGSGGGITTGNAAQAGGNGGTGSTFTTSINGPAGGAAGAAGTAGTAITTPPHNQDGGSGGSGGGADTGAGGQVGGAGGAPGGAGGGGGASINGANSGVGGVGARGELRVTAYF